MGKIRGQSLSPMNKVEREQLRFDEIDELMRVSSNEEEHAITSHLKDDMDLHSIIELHDAELANAREAFIQFHVDNAEDICGFYTEFVHCEEKVVDFDEEIIAFQRRLADSADDMVKMYQQTVGLVRSVNNRRLVSAQISDVYTVLQECDAFCETITHSEVDKEYFENISELEKKLSFLSKRELQGSAVDLETRPRFEAAAVRVGDKLQRYFTKRISALAAESDLATIASRQVEIASEGQNAICFLNNYNRPIAVDIFNEYARRMSDVFSQHIRASLRALSDVCVTHAVSVDPIVSEEEVKDLVCNRDVGSPRGSHVFAVIPHYPAHTLVRRDRSVSQHMRTLADRVLKTDHSASPREATFADTVDALFSLESDGDALSLRAGAARRLDGTNSWVWHFTRSLHLLVNLCVAECAFISRFFCFSAARAVGGAVYDETESIARAVLSRALDAALGALCDELPLVTSRQDAVAGLRAVDVAKGHLSRLQDPVPLLLLSVIIEQAKATLGGTLRELMANDRVALECVTELKLTPFQLSSSATRVHLRLLLEDPAYAATLGPHPIVQKFARTVGEINILNCAKFAGTLVDRADLRINSTTLSGVTLEQLELVLTFMHVLSKRHRSLLAQCIFMVNNIYYILEFWRGLTALLPIENEEIREDKLSKVLPLHVARLRSRLSGELISLVDEETSASGSLAYLFEYLDSAESAMGSGFFAEGEVEEIVTEALPEAVSEHTTMKILSMFGQSWIAQLHETASVVRRTLATTMAVICDGDVEARCVKGLEQLIFREYAHSVVEANTKLHSIASKLFAKNGDIHAKLTSNATLLQEIEKVLQS